MGYHMYDTIENQNKRAAEYAKHDQFLETLGKNRKNRVLQYEKTHHCLLSIEQIKDKFGGTVSGQAE